MAVPHRQPDPPPDRYITPAEYLAFERASDERHEYYDGRIYAMSGARANHEQLLFGLIALLGPQLRARGCTGFSANMRVKVSESGLYTYPDLTALCGEPAFEDEVFDTLLNPSVVVEVLSESTQHYDRGDKFAHYRTVASLREYVLVDQYAINIERHLLADGAWTPLVLRDPDDVLELPSVGSRVRLGDLYEGIVFPERPPGPRRVREGEAEYAAAPA